MAHSSSADARRPVLSVAAEPNVTVRAKMMSACVGSCLTTLVLTPMDVVKTRIQSESVIQELARGGASSVKGNATVGLPVAVTSRPLRGFVPGIVQIARYEGIGSLWRGVLPSLAMLLPANTVQFLGYETVLPRLTDWNVPASAAVAGAFARCFSATIVSPIELFRTRIQAAGSHYHQLHPGAAHTPAAARAALVRLVFSGMRDNVREFGFLSLWSGVSLTLWRDVPFSAFYWWAYEQCRAFFLQHPRLRLLPPGYSAGDPDINFMSGGIAGIGASLLTQPFDVSKTARQVHGQHLSRGQALRILWNRGGVRALWTGTLPRCAKVAPSCAIMISTYHFMKHLYERPRPSDY
ncbi:manganese ion transporter [Schizosaccharomyces japonicus yFS275]|uniref:Manganese ion transporter n=1 Tax=Schizosaccharomyces japonicus (strain yFS275 / FY16936) TaxID=402676 RepID=B6K4L5_SCHJY|nr:manganese ion transporter [Schizosaccharomyces japonicus yFS275]EEB08422.1 manganese ion transporter [Schizosaccharomyces japonicus yFS275]